MPIAQGVKLTVVARLNLSSAPAQWEVEVGSISQTIASFIHFIQLESGAIAAGLPHEDRQDRSQPAALHLRKDQAVQTEHLSSAVAEEEEEEDVVSDYHANHVTVWHCAAGIVSLSI